MTISIKQLLIGMMFIFLLSFIFTFIEILRINEDGTFNKDFIANTMLLYKDYETIQGISIRTTCLAIEGVERGLYPHTYGLFLLQSIIKGVPFIGNYIVDSFMDKNSMFLGSAHLLTIQNSGLYYTSGIGTSYIADLYIEFGIIGIIIISFLYGSLIGKFESKSKSLSFSSFASFLLISIFVGYSVYTARSTLWSFFVNFIHTWFVYIFIKFLFFRFNKWR